MRTDSAVAAPRRVTPSKACRTYPCGAGAVQVLPGSAASLRTRRLSLVLGAPVEGCDGGVHGGRDLRRAVSRRAGRDLKVGEGTSDAGNAAALKGPTIRTVAEPLAGYQQQSKPVSSAAGDPTPCGFNNNAATDSVQIDNRPVQVWNIKTPSLVTLTYTDGTTSLQNLSIVQDTAGRTCLFSEMGANSAHAALGAGPFRSLTIGHPIAFYDPGVDRVPPAHADATIVQGATANDTMAARHADGDGSTIGVGNDTVFGGTRNDSICGNMGDDTLFGGAGVTTGWTRAQSRTFFMALRATTGSRAAAVKTASLTGQATTRGRAASAMTATAAGWATTR
nr:hypothetical protein [Loktanella fryxellensis]